MGGKILIVDDEPNIVVSLEFLLKREGFETLSATDGELALAMAKSARPDVVLLDAMLPKKNGYEVCEKLRSDKELSDIGVIMLSAKGLDSEVKQGLSVGASAYLTKPFATRDLLEKIQMVLLARSTIEPAINT